MKYIIYIAFLIFYIVGCTEKNTGTTVKNILAVEFGDLNNDGIEEKVVVYNTTDTSDFGITREIQVLKKENKTWTIWCNSTNAVLKSGEGGRLGEPFVGIEIINGILIIEHYGGGGHWIWNTIDKYRFQNKDFELIGYTNYGEMPGAKAKSDFNLSTGKFIYTHYDFVDGDYIVNETKSDAFYENEVRLKLRNRNTKDIKIISPSTGKEYYL